MLWGGLAPDFAVPLQSQTERMKANICFHLSHRKVSHKYNTRPPKTIKECKVGHSEKTESRLQNSDKPTALGKNNGFKPNLLRNIFSAQCCTFSHVPQELNIALRTLGMLSDTGK
eukprot:760884-Amphidinium_carterae.1